VSSRGVTSYLLTYTAIKLYLRMLCVRYQTILSYYTCACCVSKCKCIGRP